MSFCGFSSPVVVSKKKYARFAGVACLLACALAAWSIFGQAQLAYADESDADGDYQSQLIVIDTDGSTNAADATLASDTDPGASNVSPSFQASIAQMLIKLNDVTIDDIDAGSKDDKHKNNAIEVLNADGTAIAEDEALEIKGRGNSTWLVAKKPYQIKFSTKQNLFDLGPAKKWILLANYYDPSLLRNDVALTLATDLGLAASQPGEFVDLLFYNETTQEYENHGTYYVTHKIENSSASLKLDEGGIIVELDNIHGSEEDYKFPCGSGDTLVLKEAAVDEDDPEAEELTTTALTRIGEAYDQLCADAAEGDWSAVQADCDIESFAQYYLLQEFVSNPDGYVSSFNMYQLGAESKLTAGPAWDFDTSFGNDQVLWLSSDAKSAKRLWAATNVREVSSDTAKYSELFYNLNEIPEFRALVSDIYQTKVKPNIESVKTKIADRILELSISAAQNASLWKLDSFTESAQKLADWVSARAAYLDQIYATPTTSIETGFKHIVSASTGAYAVASSSESLVMGTTGNSSFIVSQLSNGYYVFRSETGGYIAPASYSLSTGSRLGLVGSSEDKAAQWFALDAGNGTYRFVNKATGLVMTSGLTGLFASELNADRTEQLFKLSDAEPFVIVQRLAGATALDTMSKIVDAGEFASGGVAVVATIDGYWDALAASALAGAYDAPVLLTATDGLSTQTAEQLEKLSPDKVYIVGGTAAVSNSVESSIRSMGISVKRLAGETAVQTAQEISAEANSVVKSNTCVIATVNGFYDSLSVASIAYAKGYPVYLTSTDGTLADDTLTSIRYAGYSNAVIVGGTSAVSGLVEGQLAGVGVSSVRKAGDNAWQTSAAIAEWGLTLGMSVNGVGIADGNGYWDALTGAALCGKSGAVMVLVPHDGTTSEGDWFAYDPYCINNFIAVHSSSIKELRIFGGTSAVPSATEAAIRAELS